MEENVLSGNVLEKYTLYKGVHNIMGVTFI